MAEEIIINVAVDSARAQEEINTLTGELQGLIEERARLRQEVKDGIKTEAEALVEQKKVAEQITFVTTKITNLTKATETATKKNKTYGDTLTDERKKLNDMQKAFAGLTKAERESAEGREFTKKIKEQHDAVLKLEKSIGQAQRNVGNYAEDISRALGGVGGSLFGFANRLAGIKQSLADATGGAKGFAGGLKLISSIGIVAILSALVAIVTKLAQVFASSEERTNKLKKALAPLEGVLDGVTKVFSKLCDILLDQFVKAVDTALSAVKWLAGALDKVGAWFGKSWNFEANFDKFTKRTNDLADLEEAYIKKKRAFIEEEANLENQLAKLKAKSADKDKYTAQERLKFLEQANAIELSLMDKRRDLAKDALRIAEEQAKRADNDRETNDKLAEARAEVVRQETAYFEGQKKLLAQMREARNAIAQEEQARLKEEAEFYSKLDAQREAELQAEIQAQEKAQAEAVKLLDEELKRVEAQAQARRKALIDAGLIAPPTELQQELEALNIAYDSDLLSFEEYQQAKVLITEKYEAKNRLEQYKTLQQAKQKYAEAVSSYTSAQAQAFSSLSSAIGEFTKNSEDASEAQKALAVGAIVMQEAQSIADGARAIAGALAGAAEASASGGPLAPALLTAYTAQMTGAVIAVMASVASSIAKAKKTLDSVDAGKFAVGGVVGGSSYSGDKLIAHVNSREGIFTVNQQKRLFDIANGAPAGFNYSEFAEVVAGAVASLPAPVLNYNEFSNFRDRVVTINELTKI